MLFYAIVLVKMEENDPPKNISCMFDSVNLFLDIDINSKFAIGCK